MPDSEHEERVEELLEHLARVEDACRILRGSTSAVVAYRGPDESGYIFLGELDALDALLTRAASEELAEAILNATEFWVGDDVEEDDEDEDEDGDGDGDEFSL